MSADLLELGTALGPEAGPFTIRAAELTRHAVVLGATGSGKTGLLVRLVEELLVSGVSVVAIDPKGDLVGMARGPLSGLVDFRVLTPGSRAGRSLDVMSILAGPDPAEAADEEGLLLQLGDVVRGLLSLVGLEAGPLDPAWLVVSGILEAAWRSGERIGLRDLVVRIVDPPFVRLGAFPVDTILPRRDRMSLAVQLNGWLASPQLQSWNEGEPVDPDRWVSQGPRASMVILTLSHLDDALRRLAASWVLSRLAGWSRRQPGSERLRLAVVLDEAWGFCPPAPRDPSTKRPLLALAKQARAVGVGLVCASQNPVDLDYALLSNAATWFVGRLATPQDREKVTDGAPSSAREWLAELSPRMFLARRAGGAPGADWVRFRTADCRTPLGGPLTLVEIAALGAGSPPATPTPPVPEAGSGWLPHAPRLAMPARWLDPEVAFSARWAPITGGRSRPALPDGRIVWEPALLCRLSLRFDEGRTVVAEREEHRLRFPPEAPPVEPPLEPSDLVGPQEGWFVPFADPDRRALERSAAEVLDEVFRGEVERQWVHEGCKLRSTTGETRDAFRERVRAALEDRAAVAVRKREEAVRKEVARLEEKRARVGRTLASKEVDLQAKQATELAGAGEMLLGLLFGRRRSLSPAVSRRGATSKANAAVEQATDELKALERELYDRETALADELEALREEHLRGLDDVTETTVTLEREDVKITDWSVVWIPVTRPV